MMTAVAATRYDDLLALDETLTETLVEALDEETLVSLLLARFRSFIAGGYGAVDALLLSVGYAEADLAFAADGAHWRGSPVRHSSA